MPAKGPAMISISFDKAEAERFIDCLKTGKPIASSPQGWTSKDMLALAGACVFGAFSQGPLLNHQLKVGGLHDEHREALMETLLADLYAALKYYSYLTMLVCSGEYDALGFEARCEASVQIDADGDVILKAGKGTPQPDQTVE